MRLAHLSDLHLADLHGAVPWRLFNKRFTGYVNLRLRRGAIHQRRVAAAVAREIRRRRYDHIVVTGDVTNLALERELETVRNFVLQELAPDVARVSVVPGNHDMYTRGAFRTRRFERFFRAHMSSDLPGLATAHGFPYVRLRGPAAIVGLSTAVPRPPLVASGRLGRKQIGALRQVLHHPEVRDRTVVLLQHHPWHPFASRTKTLAEGLVDADEERNALAPLERGLLLHGHLHRTLWRQVDTERGHVDAVGATSASLLHPDPARAAAFNSYEIADDGAVVSLRTIRVDPASGSPSERELTREARTS